MATSRFREFFSHKRDKRKATISSCLSPQADAKLGIALNFIGEILYRESRYILISFRTVQQLKALARPSVLLHRHGRALFCNTEQAEVRDDDDNFQATPERDFDIGV
ncbi:hypothetical protein [uncultured Pseudomonas sp.]|uniref:hypothetical protein n=1 Tax=uncultured Pseudomonas sp. TaxID=114707 RepID=UPI00258DA3FA|nr:hypothetical protein [uncultured Pseudomonas sp.]